LKEIRVLVPRTLFNFTHCTYCTLALFYALFNSLCDSRHYTSSMRQFKNFFLSVIIKASAHHALYEDSIYIQTVRGLRHSFFHFGHPFCVCNIIYTKTSETYVISTVILTTTSALLCFCINLRILRVWMFFSEVSKCKIPQFDSRYVKTRNLFWPNRHWRLCCGYLPVAKFIICVPHIDDCLLTLLRIVPTLNI